MYASGMVSLHSQVDAVVDFRFRLYVGRHSARLGRIGRLQVLRYLEDLSIVCCFMLTTKDEYRPKLLLVGGNFMWYVHRGEDIWR